MSGGIAAKILEYGDAEVFEVYLKVGKQPWRLHNTFPTLKKAEQHLKACGNRKCVYKLEKAPKE